MVYEPRTYRRAVSASSLVAFQVVLAQTDLQILASRDLSDEALTLVTDVRSELEDYAAAHPRFVESFSPVPIEPDAPAIVREMAEAARVSGVGPMAAVAGAVAEHVARGLSVISAEVIVENGGDVYLMGSRQRVVGVFAGAGEGPRGVAAGLGIRIGPEMLPCAVATSSGRIGPSVSLGSADAATVIARSGALADAVASVVGNRVRSADDLEGAMAVGSAIDGVLGIVATIDGAVGAWGAVELVPLDADLT